MISCGSKPDPEKPTPAPHSCATEEIPALPDIVPEDLAGPDEGCPEEFEVCLKPAPAAKIERYHDKLRRAAEINRELCEPVPDAGAR